MRIAVHDYSGHPFQVELSRALAVRGHDVLHLYSTTFQTPKGPLARLSDDPRSFAVEGIDLGERFHKYSFVRRLIQERRYGRLLANRLEDFQPEVVISANTPLDAQQVLQRRLSKRGVPLVFWLQDIYSAAIEGMLRRRLHVVGGLLARRFARVEAALLRRSDAVVVITEDFLPTLASWHIARDRISVIENWAPLDHVSPREKANRWAREHDLDAVPVFLYAGTLGLKHDPSLLLRLAGNAPDARVVVVSEGIGADWLRDHAASTRNLVLLPFQPFEDLSGVLGSADVLLVILESDAGPFSVPSKVLTSMSAGRAVLAAIPRSNLGAKTILSARAGMVVDPSDADAFVEAGLQLIADSTLCEAYGRAGRSYAEKAFAIGPIADRFEAIFREVSASDGSPRDSVVAQPKGRREPLRPSR